VVLPILSSRTAKRGGASPRRIPVSWRHITAWGLLLRVGAARCAGEGVLRPARHQQVGHHRRLGAHARLCPPPPHLLAHQSTSYILPRALYLVTLYIYKRNRPPTPNDLPASSSPLAPTPPAHSLAPPQMLILVVFQAPSHACVTCGVSRVLLQPFRVVRRFSTRWDSRPRRRSSPTGFGRFSLCLPHCTHSSFPSLSRSYSHFLLFISIWSDSDMPSV
jgi:hypothetical protein